MVALSSACVLLMGHRKSDHTTPLMNGRAILKSFDRLLKYKSGSLVQASSNRKKHFSEAFQRLRGVALHIHTHTVKSMQGRKSPSGSGKN